MMAMVSDGEKRDFFHSQVKLCGGKGGFVLW